MAQSKIYFQPTKSAFSKSLIVMNCFKYLIRILLNNEYWTAKASLKSRRKDLPDHPLLGNGNSVNLSFYLNLYCTHISKQILWYIFSLNKCMESWDVVLIKQLIFANFAAVNNLTISAYENLIFYYYDSGNNIHDLLVYCR